MGSRSFGRTGRERDSGDLEDGLEEKPEGPKEPEKADPKKETKEKRKAVLSPAAKTSMVPPLKETRKPERREKLGEEEKARLRERPAEARSKMLEVGHGGGAGLEAELPQEDDAEEVDSVSSGYSVSVAADMEMGEGRAPAIRDWEQVRKKKKPQDRPGRPETKEKVKERRKKLGRDALALEDTKDGTMVSLQTQLLNQAAHNSNQKKERARQEQKKKKQKNPTQQLAKILTQVARQGSDQNQEGDRSGKSKKEKKKKEAQRSSAVKKRRTRGGGGDPESPSGDSPTGSSDCGSSEDWDKESSSHSDHKMIAPLKRKSKQKPGSVLQLLVQHARSQLDQSSKVGIAAAEDTSVIKGVKIGSYFSIVVRPQLGGSLGQARELHHLSQALDLLRQGDLDLLGDLLAARFMAIHQAALDGTWSTARHLELMPLEDSSAAGPEVILDARKHARLAAKCAPGDSWAWSPGAKGRGGRGRGQSWSDQNSDQKGKGKKGGKGKGKTKSWGGAEKEADSKTREKYPDK